MHSIREDTHNFILDQDGNDAFMHSSYIRTNNYIITFLLLDNLTRGHGRVNTYVFQLYLYVFNAAISSVSLVLSLYIYMLYQFH